MTGVVYMVDSWDQDYWADDTYGWVTHPEYGVYKTIKGAMDKIDELWVEWSTAWATRMNNNAEQRLDYELKKWKLASFDVPENERTPRPTLKHYTPEDYEPGDNIKLATRRIEVL